MSGAKYRPSRGVFATLGGLAGAIVRPLHGRGALVLVALALGGLAWGAVAVWQHVREHVAAQDDYRLAARDIEVTPSPPWVRSNVKGEALRDAGLTGPLSILDDTLVERLNRAFSLHPWVARVKSVSKRYPAHVEIELEYRRPVAMVEVPGGLYPVDADGVLLPSEDFSPLEARSYPRLSGVESTPLGTVGTRWGDPVVAGGAHVAEVLNSAWADLRLQSIRWQKPVAGSDAAAPAVYELFTASGHTIHWGAAPGSEPTGEPNGQEKLARLKSLARQYGSLDAAAADSPLDLRGLAPLPAPPPASIDANSQLGTGRLRLPVPLPASSTTEICGPIMKTTPTRSAVMGTSIMGKVAVAAKIENYSDLTQVENGDLKPDKVRSLEVADALVDTGATMLSLPLPLIEQLGLRRRRTRKIRSALGLADMGVYEAVRLTIQGRDCTVEVGELVAGCPVLIGQIPLEALDWVVDPIGQRLIGNPDHNGEWMYDVFFRR